MSVAVEQPRCPIRTPQPPPPDALSLPLISFRGMWDKFDGPDTMGAVRRAYRRGIPSLVRIGSGHHGLADLLAMAADPTLNRRQLPLYLVSTSLPDLRPLTGGPHGAPGVLAVQSDERHDRPWGLYRWLGGQWTSAGAYVPVQVPVSAITRASVTGEFVCFESVNVADEPAARARVNGRTDDAVLRALREATPAAAVIARVSDLVEADQLDLRIREAV